MEGNWLSKTRKAYVYREFEYGQPSVQDPAGAHKRFINGWRLVMLHGQSDYESFWYPAWEMAVRAIPDLWRH